MSTFEIIVVVALAGIGLYVFLIGRQVDSIAEILKEIRDKK